MSIISFRAPSSALSRPQIPAVASSANPTNTRIAQLASFTINADEAMTSSAKHNASVPSYVLNQRVKDSEKKINLIESEVQKIALSSDVSLKVIRDSVQALEQSEKATISRLIQSIHPDTRKFLEELAKNSGTKMAASTPPATRVRAPIPSRQETRLNRLINQIAVSPSGNSPQITTVGTSRTASAPNPETPDITEILLMHFLSSPERRLQIWEDSELRKGNDTIKEKLKENPPPDQTKGKKVHERFVIAFDGGGIRGKISAEILLYIEKKTKKLSHQLFDLMAGTSTGAILALGASIQGANGKSPFSAKEMVNIYDTHGSTIFSRKTFSQYASGAVTGAIGGLGLSQISRFHNFRYSKHTGLGLGTLAGVLYRYKNIDDYFTTKYTRDGLEQVVRTFFGDKKLGDRVKHKNKDDEEPIELLIPTCFASSRKPVLFDTAIFAQKDSSSWTQFQTIGKDEDLVRDVLMSTTAAPSFFPPFTFKHDSGPVELVDGGVCFNNPALLAYNRARQLWKDDKIHLLSLGTGYTQTGKFGSGGKVHIVADLIDTLFQAQSYSTSKYLDTLAGTLEASHSGTDLAGALTQKKITLNPSLPEGVQIQIPYRPLESYVRVDGVLSENIELDSTNLLNPGKNDPFTTAAHRFIIEANYDSKKNRLTLDRFLEKMRNYHGF